MALHSEPPLAQGLQGPLKANLSLHDDARCWLEPADRRALARG